MGGGSERDETKRAITDQKVTLGAVTRIETDGTSAYVVVPSVYSFKQQGVAMRESAQMTFGTQEGCGGLADLRVDLDRPEGPEGPSGLPEVAAANR